MAKCLEQLLKTLISDEFGSALPISGERKFLEILSFFNFQILQLPTIMYEIRKKKLNGGFQLKLSGGWRDRKWSFSHDPQFARVK